MWDSKFLHKQGLFGPEFYGDFSVYVTDEETFFGPYPAEDRTRIARGESQTHYCVAIKAGLYRKAVQVCSIPIQCDILPLHIEIRPQNSGSTRLT